MGAPQGPRSGSPSGGLILGGLIAATALMIFTVVVVGAAILFFLYSSRPADPAPQPPPEPTSIPRPETTAQPVSEPTTEPRLEPTTEPTTEPEPAPEPAPEPTGEPDGPVPGQGPLDELIQEQVGEFRLQSVETDPEALSNGAVAARDMVYLAPDGVELLHTMFAFPAAEAASEAMVAYAESVDANTPLRPVRTFPVANEAGEVVGDAILLRDRNSDATMLMWTDDVLFLSATAPDIYVEAFFGASRY